MWRGWVGISLFLCFVGPFSVQSYSHPTLSAMYIICVWCTGDRDPAHENSTRIPSRNSLHLTEFCIRCVPFNVTFGHVVGHQTLSMFIRCAPFNVTLSRCWRLNAVQFLLSEILIGRPLFVILTRGLPILDCMCEFRIPYLGMVYLPPMSDCHSYA